MHGAGKSNRTEADRIGPAPSGILRSPLVPDPAGSVRWNVAPERTGPPSWAVHCCGAGRCGGRAMTAIDELLGAGRLAQAIEQVKSELRTQPADLRRRTILFELLCF